MSPLCALVLTAQVQTLALPRISCVILSPDEVAEPLCASVF
jgi:hypothetical protein